ncbi:MAG: hypothetical protein NZ895_03815 [Archaeoglobaceae archaeon]|nr:hypothetical protein [Archaeoglobaceae archaeon]MCX8152435.1 hypothetical protein [Archaeoglobaceae archaeon]MDW8013775.1 hypothetical protein [Archaeoglobaceae archaeon]
MLGRILKIALELAIGLIIISLIAGYFLSITPEQWKVIENMPIHQKIGYLIGDFLRYVVDFTKAFWEGFTRS